MEVHVAVAAQRGLQSIISDLRPLDPYIELRTLRGLWFHYQFAKRIMRKKEKDESRGCRVGRGRRFLVGCDE